jgi:hypothetical protein
MKKEIGIILLASMCSVLIGCKQAAEKAAEKALEKAIEADSGEKVDIDLKKGGMTVVNPETGESMTMDVKETDDGQTLTFTGADGETRLDIRETKELPADWPEGFPIYPGCEIEAVQSMSIPEMKQHTLTLQSNDGIDEVLEFYADAATKAGFNQEMHFTSEEGGQATFVWENHRFVVVVSKEGNGTVIVLQNILMTEDRKVMEETPSQNPEAQGEVEETEPEEESEIPEIKMTQGSLPEGFPSDLIPPLENGEILQAAFSENEGMLMQSTKSAVDEVMKFYKEHFESKGYTQMASMNIQGIRMMQYEGEGKNISITCQADEDANQVTISWGLE